MEEGLSPIDINPAKENSTDENVITNAEQNFIQKISVLILAQAHFRRYSARKSLQREESIENVIRNLSWKYISLQSDTVKALYNKVEPFKFENSFKFSTIKISTNDDNDVYVGEFNERNAYEGRGIKILHSGGVIEGHWKNNGLHGSGRVLFPFGQILEGNWIDDEQDGEFITYDFKGLSYKSLHKNGTLIRVLNYNYRNGIRYFADTQNERKGRVECPDGGVYEGEFQDSKAHGPGKWYFNKNGQRIIIEGLWEFGEKIADYKKTIGISKIESGLFLGSINDASDARELEILKIKNAVQALSNENLCPRFPGINYHFMCLRDDENEDLSKGIKSAVIFIDSKIRMGENVLVHCHKGISRSCSIVVAYLMAKYKIDYFKAFAMVCTKRRMVWPNKGFQAQLQSEEYQMAYKWLMD